MSEEEKKVNTEETEQVEETKPAVTTTETKPEEPKEEPKKGLLKRASESKAVKTVGVILALFGAAKIGEKIGEAKERKRSESEIIDAEPTEYSDGEEDTE